MTTTLMSETAFWQLIRGRRSIRHYQDRNVPPDLVWRILEAAHWAPSAHNRQPWRFVVVERGPLRHSLARAMADRWREDLLRDGWPEVKAISRAERSYQRLTRAPVLILLALSMKDMDRYPDPARQAAEHTMAIQSTALAGQNLLLAAHHYNLGACWLCAPLFVPELVRTTLSLPPDWEPQALITVGYPAEEKAGQRVPLTSRVSWLPGNKDHRHHFPRAGQPASRMTRSLSPPGGSEHEPPTPQAHPSQVTNYGPGPASHSSQSTGRSVKSSTQTTVVILAGGVGGAKGAQGLYQLLPPDTLTVIVNTGDDFEHLGLPISPDLDTVMYTLAGVNHPQQGWGLAGDTFQALAMLSRYGAPTWFQLGDRDLATHILRRHLRDQGWSLTRITDHFCQALGVRARVLPMTDDPVRTVIVTPEGPLPFQEYFVHRRCEPPAREIRFEGAEQAHPTPEVWRALLEADALVLGPSNPYLSLDPILSLQGVRERLRAQRERVVAITPIVGGHALKGPAAKLMREFGEEPSPLTVARRYADFLGAFVLDERDAHLQDEIAALGMRVAVTDTVMNTPEDRGRVARTALETLGLEV